MATTTNYTKITLAAGKAIGLAVVLNGALFFLLFIAKMIDPHVGVGPNNEPIAIVAVTVNTIMFMVIATIYFLLLVRFAKEPARAFTQFCIVGFIITLTNPFLLIPDVPFSMALAVDLLHIIPAYFIWRYLTRAVA